jgi:hypothetical protein
MKLIGGNMGLKQLLLASAFCFVSGCSLFGQGQGGMETGAEQTEEVRSASIKAEAFMVAVEPAAETVKAGEEFSVRLLAKNVSNTEQEFWVVRCGSSVNWWHNLRELELGTTEQCDKSVPTLVNVQPGGVYVEEQMFQFSNVSQPGQYEVQFGFAPWQSKEQLKERWVLDTPLELATAMTVWSNPVQFSVSTRGSLLQ